MVTDLSSYERLTGLALLPDGKLITAGVGLLLRYLPDGTLDAAFGTGGSAPLTIGNYGRSGLAVQPDGRIVVGGTETGGGGDHAVLERHLPDGALDVTFGNGGVRSLPSGNGTQTREVLVRPDGRLLVLVQGAEGGGYRYGLAQLLPDGTLDPAFGGGNGYTANGELGLPQNVQGEHVALFPDGRIAGVGWRFAPPDDFSLLVARHLPDGALDPVFGNGGFVASTLGGDQALGYGGAAVLPDGRLLVGGQYVSNSTYEFLLASLLDDAAVAVSAAPTAPATIPPGGGAFAFTLRLANATDQPQTVEAWTEADGPASRSPVLGPRSVTLAPHATLTRTLTQRVPGSAPAGDYVYAVRAGAFPDGAVTSASFPVTKAAGALAARTSGDAVWTIEGWDETAAPASAASEVPAALSLSSASPNPFRGGARITLAVPSAQPFRVAVYDALGREVAVLLDGEAEAGAHALALDGRGLAAGVYVVRAEGAGAVAVRRVVRY